MSIAIDKPVAGSHNQFCKCDLCSKTWDGFSIPSNWEPTKINIQQKLDAAPDSSDDLSTDYRPDSLVFKQKKKIKELIDSHWSYQEKLLSVGQDKGQTFTWEQVMEMRRWDYISAAAHFYGHGHEDAIKEEQHHSEPALSKMSIEQIEQQVIRVCNGWGLYDDTNASDRTRFAKLLEELYELSEALFIKDVTAEIKMEAGDVLITLINVLHMKGITLEQALLSAYMKIKDRKGKMVKGYYVKEEDL